MGNKVISIIGIGLVGFIAYKLLESSKTIKVPTDGIQQSNVAISNTPMPLLTPLPMMQQPVPSDISVLPDYLRTT